MNRRQITLIVGLVISLIVIITLTVILIRPGTQDPILLINKSDITDYRPLGQQSAIYLTRSNTIGIATIGKNTIENSYPASNTISISPTGKFYSLRNDNTITIYNSTTNTPVQTLSAQQFIWQGNDSIIYNSPLPKTTNPLLATDDRASDNIPLPIYFKQSPTATAKNISSKQSNGQVQYSQNNDTLTYLKPDTTSNPLQNSIVTQISPSLNKEVVKITSYQIRSFESGNTISDVLAGVYYVSGANITKLNNFTSGDTIDEYKQATVILHINSNQSNHSLEATNISTKKTTIISLSMPDFFSNQTVDLPYTVDNTLMFRSNTGLFTYKLP